MGMEQIHLSPDQNQSDSAGGSEREFPKELCAGMNTEELRGYLDFFNQSIQVGVGEFMIAQEKAEERHKSWLNMKERQKKIIEAELEKRKE